MNKTLEPDPMHDFREQHSTDLAARVGWLGGASHRAAVTVLGFAIGLVVVGCHSGQNPSADPYANATRVTTASVEGARAADTQQVEQQRDYAPVEVRAVDGAVTHGPLLFEDPLEETISDDGRFAWTGGDYLYWVYGPASYFVDVAVAPLSLIVAPPWQATASDGNAEHRAWTPGIHDAKARSTVTDEPPPPAESDSNSG